jgi:hypothetical protein
MPKTPLTGILTVTGTTTVSKSSDQYQPADRPGASTNQWKTFYTKDAAISGTLSGTEGRGGCDHVFVDPATTRVSDLGSATKEYNKLYVEDAARSTVTSRYDDQTSSNPVPTS